MTQENQLIFLKEKRICEPDSFLSQAARWYVCERTPYSLCSLDRTTHFLLAAWNTRRFARSKSELMAENALLRQQLIMLKRQVKRPACTKTDRMLLVLVAWAVRAWKQTLFLVQPETLLRLHRELFRLYWKRKSKASSYKPK